MKGNYGKCGCNCGKCPAYIGNIKSAKDKEKCSEGWRKYLNINLKHEMCICLGCQVKDPWQTGNFLPDRSCLVKKCADHNHVKTCAHCFSFPCDFLEERSKKDFSRMWVEKRVGETISDEVYESFVEPYETFRHLQSIRQGLSDLDLSPVQKVAPLTIKVAKFPELINQTEVNIKILQTTYDFLINLLGCNNQTTYLKQALSERRIKPAFVILWVFATYGKMIDNGSGLKLTISSEDYGDNAEFKSIIRKRDNTWHGSAEEVSFLLNEYGLKMEHEPVGRRGWLISLLSTDSDAINVLTGLKMFSEKLIEKYGIPEYTGSWKYTGEAFKCFKKADFTCFS